MPNAPLKINQSLGLYRRYGDFMVYFKAREAFFKGGLHLRALKRVCCRILSRLIVRVWGK
ncbi:hypothetical protein [Helicobacter pylori]|uniref:hypothetical protein n=1 Tax=Helicobacter pylori TaxID=210 RepID=UPI0018E1EF9C|nr:hypothetical protein [Helicobacter pylori]